MWDHADTRLIPKIFHQDFTFRGSLGPELVGHTRQPDIDREALATGHKITKRKCNADGRVKAAAVHPCVEVLPADQAAFFVATRARTNNCPDRTMKISKTEARYGRGTQSEHCGKSFADDKNFCRQFIEPGYPTNQTGTCTEVSGSVGRVYRCKLWLKAPSR
jgi:hypothetical protein